MKESSIEKEYEKAFEQAAALQPIFPNTARQQMAHMVESMVISNKNIDAI